MKTNTLVCILSILLNSIRGRAEVKHTSVLALYDEESKVVIYKDPFYETCFYEFLPELKVILRKIIYLLPDEVSQSAPPILLSRFQKEFCGNYSIHSLIPSKTEVKFRKKRSSTSYSTHSGSQTQIQGRVQGDGFFSGQGQAGGDGSQTQIQIGGVGLTGFMSSVAGGSQARINLRSKSGDGQASTSGMGPSSTVLGLNLGEGREGTNGHASASQRNQYTSQYKMHGTEGQNIGYQPGQGESHGRQHGTGYSENGGSLQYYRNGHHSYAGQSHSHSPEGRPGPGDGQGRQQGTGSSGIGSSLQYDRNGHSYTGQSHSHPTPERPGTSDFPAPDHWSKNASPRVPVPGSGPGHGDSYSGGHGGSYNQGAGSHYSGNLGLANQIPGVFAHAPGGQAQAQSVVLGGSYGAEGRGTYHRQAHSNGVTEHQSTIPSSYHHSSHNIPRPSHSQQYSSNQQQKHFSQTQGIYFGGNSVGHLPGRAQPISYEHPKQTDNQHSKSRKQFVGTESHTTNQEPDNQKQANGIGTHRQTQTQSQRPMGEIPQYTHPTVAQNQNQRLNGQMHVEEDRTETERGAQPSYHQPQTIPASTTQSHVDRQSHTQQSTYHRQVFGEDSLSQANQSQIGQGGIQSYSQETQRHASGSGFPMSRSTSHNGGGSRIVTQRRTTMYYQPSVMHYQQYPQAQYQQAQQYAPRSRYAGTMSMVGLGTPIPIKPQCHIVSYSCIMITESQPGNPNYQSRVCNPTNGNGNVPGAAGMGTGTGADICCC